MENITLFYSKLRKAKAGAHELAQEKQKDVYVYQLIYGPRADRIEFSLRFIEDLADRYSKNIVYKALFIEQNQTKECLNIS